VKSSKSFRSTTLKEVADLPLDGTSGEHLSSVMNLMNYVIMRREDLRALQERLTTAGLSSLGRGGSNVLANINRVIDMLSRAVLHEPRANKKGTDTFSRQTQKGTALKCIRPH
jgi:hypothetical protein